MEDFPVETQVLAENNIIWHLEDKIESVYVCVWLFYTDYPQRSPVALACSATLDGQGVSQSSLTLLRIELFWTF